MGDSSGGEQGSPVITITDLKVLIEKVKEQHQKSNGVGWPCFGK